MGHRIPVKNIKIRTRYGSNTFTAILENIGCLTLYKGRICYEAAVWHSQIGLPGTRRVRIRIEPENYGLGGHGVFDKDIISCSLAGERMIGEVMFDMRAFADGEEPWLVKTQDGQIVCLKDVREVRVKGSLLEGDSIENFVSETLRYEKNEKPDVLAEEKAEAIPQPAPVQDASPAAEEMKVYEVYTDGACIGNPGPAGAAFILTKNGDAVRERRISIPSATNNFAELTAAIDGIRDALLETPDRLTVFSDSRYVVDGATKWIYGWLRNDWVNSSGNPVANKELWMMLDQLRKDACCRIEFRYVPGHSNVEYNERADMLACKASKEAAKQVAS